MHARARSPWSSAALLALACGLGASASCFDLPPVEERCGNHVVETSRGEACDMAQTDGEASLCAQPGDAHECQFVTDDEHECPDGFREGSDGLCSEPSGAFNAASQPRREIAGVNARTGDVDADGQLDVVVDTPDFESSAVLFLTRTDAGYDVETQALSSGLGAVADLSEDGAADVATTTRLFGATTTDSIVVLRGRTDRDLQPKIYTRDLYPGDVRYAALPAVLAGPDVTGSIEGLLAVYRDPDASCGNAWCYCVGDTSCPTGALPDLEIPDGQPLEIGSAHDDRAVVLAARGNTTVLVARFAPPGVFGPFFSIAFEAGAMAPRIIGAPIMRDLDGDGVRDLAVLARNEGCAGLYVLSGPSADWTEASMLTLARQLPENDACRQEQTFGAIAFLNADDVPDFAFGSQGQQSVLYVSDPDAPVSTDVADTHTRVEYLYDQWRDVAVGDVNGDGLDDLAAATANDNAIEVVLGGEVVPPTLWSNKVAGMVRKITVADVDGDGLGDVVSAAGEPSMVPICEKLDRVEVAYGRAEGFPEPSVGVGELAGIEQLYAVTIAEPLDGIRDVALSTTCVDAGETTHPTTILRGDVGREIFTPFVLQELAPLRLFSADLSGDGHPDIIATGLDTETGNTARATWILPSTGDANLDASTAILVEKSSGTTLTQGFAADVDHSGRFVLGAEVFPAVDTDPVALRLSLYDVDGDEVTLTHASDIGSLAALAELKWRIVQLAPLAPGAARFLIVADEVLGPMAAPQSIAVLASENDEGGFDVIPLALPSTSSAFTDAAVFEGEGLAKTAIVATDHALYRVGDDGSLTALLAGGVEVTGIVIETIVAGDFSGDGLDDLLVVDRNGGRVLEQARR